MIEMVAGTQLEEWYWHRLYFTDWTEASNAQKYIRQTIDQCCDVGTVHPHQYIVEFSTNYRFTSDDHHALAQVISPEVVECATFNEEGEENPLCWPEPEEELKVSLTRTRIARGFCTLCGNRTSYGLWCAKCKRTSLKSGVGFGESDEPDGCDFCDMLLEGHAHEALLFMACLVLAALFLLAVLLVAVLPGLLTGMLVGLVLWWLRGRREKHAACSTLF